MMFHGFPAEATCSPSTTSCLKAQQRPLKVLFIGPREDALVTNLHSERCPQICQCQVGVYSMMTIS